MSKSNEYPLIPIEWEPTSQGVTLTFYGDSEYKLNMISVRELRDDMTDASELSRGRERLDIMVSEVEPFDRIYVAGDVLAVSDVLASKDGTVVQFGENYTEITMPSDKQITVYRSIE